jgi:DNA-binding CsgD family transcriptional regulator
VLLKAREDDRQELEKKLVSMMHTFVAPYLDRLRATALSGQQQIYLNIIDTTIANVLSPYLDKLATRCMQLAPVELQVAQLIRENRSSKDIARALNLSIKTVETYRKRIRRKLGLQHSKTNLRTFFSTLS